MSQVVLSIALPVPMLALLHFLVPARRDGRFPDRAGAARAGDLGRLRGAGSQLRAAWRTPSGSKCRSSRQFSRQQILVVSTTNVRSPPRVDMPPCHTHQTFRPDAWPEPAESGPAPGGWFRLAAPDANSARRFRACPHPGRIPAAWFPPARCGMLKTWKNCTERSGCSIPADSVGARRFRYGFDRLRRGERSPISSCHLAALPMTPRS
jgi:hypothetical protein